jgi:hypothetical protein
VQWETRYNTTLTDNNLYNTYHKRALEEIIDPDARLVTGYFRLKPTDIFQLSFRKLYYFEKELYRLNKIIDYDLDQEKLVKCEFIKAKDPGQYTPKKKFIEGGDDTMGSGGDILPIKPPEKPPLDNYYPHGNTVAGRNNSVAEDATGIVIVGDNNIVGGGAVNIHIVGSDNIIFGGNKNVSLIQCSGLEVKKSDALYINNCEVSDCPVTQNDVESGIDDRSGQAELVDSTVTVINSQVTTGAIIIVTPVDTFAGNLTVTANPASFDINSSIVGESGMVNYFIASY